MKRITAQSFSWTQKIWQLFSFSFQVQINEHEYCVLTISKRKEGKMKPDLSPQTVAVMHEPVMNGQVIHNSFPNNVFLTSLPGQVTTVVLPITGWLQKCQKVCIGLMIVTLSTGGSSHALTMHCSSCKHYVYLVIPNINAVSECLYLPPYSFNILLKYLLS